MYLSDVDVYPGKPGPTLFRKVMPLHPKLC